MSRGQQSPDVAPPRVVYFRGEVPVHASIRFSSRPVHGHASDGSTAAQDAQRPDHETGKATEPNFSLHAFWRTLSNQWSVLTSEDLHAKEPNVTTCVRAGFGCPESSARLERWYDAMGKHTLQVFSLATPFMAVLSLAFLASSDWTRSLRCSVVGLICYGFTFKNMHPLFCRLLPVIAAVVCTEMALLDISEGGHGVVSTCNVIVFMAYAIRFPWWMCVASFVTAQVAVWMYSGHRTLPPLDLFFVLSFFIAGRPGPHSALGNGGIRGMADNIRVHWSAVPSLRNDCSDENDSRFLLMGLPFLCGAHVVSDMPILRAPTTAALSWAVIYRVLRRCSVPVPRFMLQLARAVLGFWMVADLAASRTSLENEAMVTIVAHCFIVYGSMNAFVVIPVAAMSCQQLMSEGCFEGGYASIVFVVLQLVLCASSVHPHNPAEAGIDLAVRYALRCMDAIKARYSACFFARPAIFQVSGPDLTEESFIYVDMNGEDRNTALAFPDTEFTDYWPLPVLCGVIYDRYYPEAEEARGSQFWQSVHGYVIFQRCIGPARRRFAIAHIRSWFSALSICMTVFMTLNYFDVMPLGRLYLVADAAFVICTVGVFVPDRYVQPLALSLTGSLMCYHAHLDSTEHGDCVTSFTTNPAISGFYGMCAFRMSSVQVQALYLVALLANGTVFGVAHCIVLVTYYFVGRGFRARGGIVGMMPSCRTVIQSVIDTRKADLPSTAENVLVCLIFGWRSYRILHLGHGDWKWLVIAFTWHLATRVAPGQPPRCAKWLIETILAFSTIALPTNICERDEISAIIMNGIVLSETLVHPWYCAAGILFFYEYGRLPFAPLLFGAITTVWSREVGKEASFTPYSRLFEYIGSLVANAMRSGFAWPSDGSSKEEEHTWTFVGLSFAAIAVAMEPTKWQLPILVIAGGFLSTTISDGRGRMWSTIVASALLAYCHDWSTAIWWLACTRLLAQAIHDMDLREKFQEVARSFRGPGSALRAAGHQMRHPRRGD